VTDDAIFTAPPPIPTGTFPFVLTNIERVVLDTAEGQKELTRWTGSVDIGDGGDLMQIDALSSLAFGPRSKARRWATVLLGKDQSTVTKDELVGKHCLAVLTEDDNGFTRLADLIPPLGKR
jgi:hypothetical protein